MKNQELNPLELFFQSSSDACNLECSEQEELENRFAEWWKNNQQKVYSEEDLKEAFAMGRKNATIKDFNTKFKNK